MIYEDKELHIDSTNKKFLLVRKEGNGKIFHEDAIKKVEKEFNIYREREMKELQSDFDLLMKSLPSNKEGKNYE